MYTTRPTLPPSHQAQEQAALEYDKVEWVMHSQVLVLKELNELVREVKKLSSPNRPPSLVGPAGLDVQECDVENPQGEKTLEEDAAPVNERGSQGDPPRPDLLHPHYSSSKDTGTQIA